MRPIAGMPDGPGIAPESVTLVICTGLMALPTPWSVVSKSLTEARGQGEVGREGRVGNARRRPQPDAESMPHDYPPANLLTDCRPTPATFEYITLPESLHPSATG